MANKQKTVEFQKVIHDENEWKEYISYSGTVFIEIHPSWCGPCECIKPQLWKLSLDDESIKFCTAASEKIPTLKEFVGKVKPVFMVFKGGQKKATIEGVNGPAIFAAINGVPVAPGA